MSAPIHISVKSLSELALPSFCPRCFWLKTHVSKLPFQIFPGIFTSIDSYTKRVVHGWLDANRTTPPWLGSLGEVVSYKPPPHYTQFNILDSKTNILLRGMPDGILLRSDGSHLIVDYKTAKFSGTQDALFPMYTAQLNAYGLIGEQCGFAPFSGLALIYMEPVTDSNAASQPSNQRQAGFAMGFEAYVLPVSLDFALIPPLLEQVRAISDLPQAPPGLESCQDCRLVAELLAAATS